MALTATKVSSPNSRGTFHTLPNEVNRLAHSAYIRTKMKDLVSYRAIGRWSERWVITGATSATTPLDAIAANNLPTPGTAWNATGTYVYSEVEVEDTDNPTVWYATVTVDVNPIHLPAEVHCTTDHVEEAQYSYFDQAGNRRAIANSAGDLFGNAIMQNRAKQRFEIICRKAYFAHESIPVYADHQNAKTFMDFPRGTVYCSDIRAHYQDTPITHYVVNYLFQVDLKGWKHRPMDAGPSHLGAEPGHSESEGLKHLLNEDDVGTIHGGSAFLDGSGRLIGRNANTGALLTPPVQLEFDTIPYVDFNALKLFEV